MPIYEIRPDRLQPLESTTFQAAGVMERGHIQRLLRGHIAALDEHLLVIGEEFCDWVDSGRRIDLLCIDQDAKLVVVELKRTEDGGHMELQAIRYAAMVSAMTFDQAVNTLARHRQPGNPDQEAARAEILAHLGWAQPDEGAFAAETRIILAAADFSKELTTAVFWLRDHNVDIRCVRLKPYRFEDGRLLLDVQQLIPLPEAAALQTQIGAKHAAQRKALSERNDLCIAFLSGLQDRAAGRSPRHAERTPSTSGVLTGSIGKGGFTINYVVGEAVSRVELLIQTLDAKEQLGRLAAQKDAIEADFGAPLAWRLKDEARQCRVLYEVDGGHRSAPEAWPEIQDRLLDAMMRLDRALSERVAALP